jgi:hypothetical protein
VYCKSLEKNPPPPEGTAITVVEEEEPPPPVPQNVALMVVEDELALFPQQEAPPIIIDAEVREVPQPRRRLGPMLIGGGIAGACLCVAIAVIFAWQYLDLDALGIQVGGNQQQEPVVPVVENTQPVEFTATPVVIVVTATDPPVADAPIFTDTPFPTLTLAPTSTPQADTPAGSILELGEWWMEDGVWLRVADFRVDVQSSLWIDLEIWNKTGQTLMFSWHPSGNFMLVDNTGHSYPLYSTFSGGTTMNTIFEVDELDRVDFHQYATSLQYQDDYIFNSNVRELILTVTGFSRIDQAQFRLEVNK